MAAWWPSAFPRKAAKTARCISSRPTRAGHLPDTIPGVQYPTGGGSAAWNADGTGIFYTRYPRPGERPEADLHFYQQVWFHKLGTPESADTYRAWPRVSAHRRD